MPLARIEIEQITGSGWVARVEAQDFNMNARGLNLRADSFDEIMILVEDGYREIVPLEAPPKKPSGPPLDWQKPTAPEPHPHVEPADYTAQRLPEPPPVEVRYPQPKIGSLYPKDPARDVKSSEPARTQPPVRIDAPAAKPRGDQAPFVPEPFPPRDDVNPYVPKHGPSRR